MLLFLFAFQGALPPEVFTELHREANVVHRSLSAIAIEGAGGDEMLPMTTVEERLPSVMPTKSEGARAENLAALRADASDGFVPLAAVATAGAAPFVPPLLRFNHWLGTTFCLVSLYRRSAFGRIA